MHEPAFQGQFGPVQVRFEQVREQAEVVYPVPWLPHDQPQKTSVNTFSQTAAASVRGLKVQASDVSGARKHSQNGTSIIISLDMSRLPERGQTSPNQAFIEQVYRCLLQMRPELLQGLPGYDQMNAQERERVATERILQAFNQARQQTTLTAQGQLELAAWTPSNLMSGKGNLNAIEVLFDFLSGALKDNPNRARWSTISPGSAREMSLQASRRPYYSPILTELGLESRARDATTLVGSLYRGRMLLYDTRHGAEVSQTQIHELEKAGLLYGTGPRQGTLNRAAFLIVLGKMRNELGALYNDAIWRANHLPPKLKREQFTANLEGYLRALIRSLWSGLKTCGRTQEAFPQFESNFSLEQIRSLDQFITEENLGSESDGEILRRWQTRKPG